MLGSPIPAFTSLETMELGAYILPQFADCYEAEIHTGFTQISNITISNLRSMGGYCADVLPIPRFIDIVGGSFVLAMAGSRVSIHSILIWRGEKKGMKMTKNGKRICSPCSWIGTLSQIY